MSLEIERKFLVTSKDYRSESKKIDIEQAYFVANKNLSIRIRIEGLIASINIKTYKTERTNNEFEYTIPIDEARYLINKTKYKIIKKTRYLYNYKGKIWEIDEFKDKHLGLVIAEIELNEENEKFELPSWVGKEITCDPQYRNSNLAKIE
tara:strand:- start:955 stop:1404 length:450 start_codon:yes stop_codon:yes gene_type:complete